MSKRGREGGRESKGERARERGKGRGESVCETFTFSPARVQPHRTAPPLWNKGCGRG